MVYRRRVKEKSAPSIKEVTDWIKENKYKPVGEEAIKEDGVVVKIIYTFQKKGGGRIRQFVFKKRGVE